MNIEDVLALGKSEEKYPVYDFNAFDASLGTEIWYSGDAEIGKHLTASRIISWTCTDTGVGILAYFFNEKFVAFSKQPYRKADEVLYWVSEEDANVVRSFLLTFQTSSNKPRMIVDINLDDLVREYSNRKDENTSYNNYY